MTDVVTDPAAEKPTETPAEEQTPPLSPRQQAMNEIVAQTEGQHEADNQTFRETVQEVDESGKPLERVEAAPEGSEPTEEPVVAEGGEESGDTAPPPEGVIPQTTFDPAKEYELIVDGHKVMVKGEKIIEMGRRSLQKEAAADLRLSLASRILEEAKQRAAQSGPPPEQREERQAPLPSAVDEMKLAEAIQFGSKEEAAAAIKELSSRRGEQVTPDQVMNFVRSNLHQMVAGELEFTKAAEFVASEYGALMEKPKLKQLFFMEEQRLRQAGDRRSYKDLYKAIGDDIRQEFNLKPPVRSTNAPTNGKTMEQRREDKVRSTPPVPRTAAARLDSPAAPKAPSQLDILNQMRAARKQPQLNG